MLKRYFTPVTIALVFAATAAAQSRAAYTIQTSISGVSNSVDGNVTLTPLTQGSTFTAGASTVTIGTAGGYMYTDSAGSTIYFVNDLKTPNIAGVANEQVFVTTTASLTPVNDSSTFTFTMNTSINGSPAFAVSADKIRLDIVSGGDQNYYGTTGTLSPTTYLAGGVTYTGYNPLVTDGNVNSQNNGSISLDISASVPEPASIAMLGLGLAGAGGFAFIRRRRSSR
jgi:hypothetical protein